MKRVQRLLGAAKAGHTGTLDPAATGVLAVCVGDAVKLQQWLVEGDKAYEATFAFGAATDTEDGAGEVVARGDPGALDEATIRAALGRFVGAIEQVPPMYSAVRVGGRRLHEAARAGEEVDRAPRPVRVDALVLRGLERTPALLLARVDVSCGKGTYVRTLAADLGRAVGVPAHLAALRRTRAGPFNLSQAIPLEEAEALARPAPGEAARGERLAARLVPPEEALSFLPAEALGAGEARDLVHGRTLARDRADGLLRALGEGGRLLAVCEARGGVIRPVRVLVTPADLGRAPPEVAPTD